MVTTRTNRLDPSMLDPGELRNVLELLSSTGSPALVDELGNRIDLPKPIFEQLLRVLKMMKEGRAVVMLPEDEAFTSQAAADYLGMSRQHLVNLLEAGEIEFHRVGSHRRVYFKDLLEYEHKRDSERRQTLDKIFDEVEDAELYESSHRSSES